MKKRLAAFFAIAALMVAVSIPAESRGLPSGVLFCQVPSGLVFEIVFGPELMLHTAGAATLLCLSEFFGGGHPVLVVINGDTNS